MHLLGGASLYKLDTVIDKLPIYASFVAKDYKHCFYSKAYGCCIHI